MSGSSNLVKFLLYTIFFSCKLYTSCSCNSQLSVISCVQVVVATQSCELYKKGGSNIQL